MKKIFLITMICAAAMVGCTHDDETPELKEMNFSPLSYKSTRAIIDGQIYKSTDPNFGVFAYYSESNDWKAGGGLAPIYINNAEISYNDEDKIWKSATPAYWPLDGSLTFYAYSPKSVGAAVDPSTKVLTITDFEVSKTYTGVTGQADLLYSLPSTATELTANVTTYTGVDGGAQGVGIIFRHALSQVLVKVRVADTYTNTEFKVKSIKLINMKDKATFTLTPVFSETEGEYTEISAWGATATQIDQVVFPSGLSDLLTTTGAQIGDGILVMPQNLVTSTQQLVIEYQMTKTDITPNVTTSTTKTVDLRKEDFTEFGINKKVTLNITISADEIFYAPSVVEWESESSVDYDNLD